MDQTFYLKLTINMQGNMIEVKYKKKYLSVMGKSLESSSSQITVETQKLITGDRQVKVRRQVDTK